MAFLLTIIILGFQCRNIIINLVSEELQMKYSSFLHVVSFRTVWLESPLTDCGATALYDVQCGGATCRNANCVSACGSSGFSGELDTVEFYQKRPTHFSFHSYGTRTDALRTSAYLRLRAQLERNSQNTNCNKQESRSQWPCGLRRRSSAARLLRLWVRIPPGAWMFVCCECCV